MSKFIDLTGQRFGRLTVLKRADDYVNPSGRHCVMWRCKCECGNEKDILGNSLTTGKTMSCGCYNEETRSKVHKKFNKYKIIDDYIVAKTSNGVEFYIDADDEYLMSEYCFCMSSHGYIVTNDRSGRRQLLLHRLVMQLSNEDNYCIDHIDGNPLNNCKNNLRIVSKSQNAMNSKINLRNTSGVTGVYAVGKKWLARITVDNNEIHLGCFSDFNDAVAARRAAEDKYFGEYSYRASRGGE